MEVKSYIVDCSVINDFHSTPSTNIHWNINVRQQFSIRAAPADAVLGREKWRRDWWLGQRAISNKWLIALQSFAPISLLKSIVTRYERTRKQNTWSPDFHYSIPIGYTLFRIQHDFPHFNRWTDICCFFFVNYDTHHMRISLQKKFEKYDFNEETWWDGMKK